MDQQDFPLTRDAIERTERAFLRRSSMDEDMQGRLIGLPLATENPPQLGALYDAHEVWDRYDRNDQDFKRARWAAVAVGWVMAQDDMVRKLLGPMTLPELIDLDATLTDLRHEVRRVISQQPEGDEPPDQPG